MTKTIHISGRPRPKGAEAWVSERKLPAVEVETCRISVDIDKALHRRMRLKCVQRDVKMADEVRRLIEVQFPPEGQGDSDRNPQ